ncbi:MAG TPA: hypothetical protein ENN07_00475 [candidate division Zixibacteria bacterium]|nr:hypothetical protein [candidate division Zixibacteria bacterium]
MKKQTFDILMLHGRPAAGKSEIIDYLKKTPAPQRVHRFHIDRFEEIDDFPMLWTWFEEDDILEKMGKPRLHTTPDGYFIDYYMWDLLVERINLEYKKRIRDMADYHDFYTAIIEFSRGSEHGGYAYAYKHLSEEILRKAAILFIDVSFEESLRKNRRRFNPDRPDSILEHGLDDEKMHALYREVDWKEFTAGDAEFVEVKGIRVPFVVFPNDDDVTTARGDELGERLDGCMTRLWKNYIAR